MRRITIILFLIFTALQLRAQVSTIENTAIRLSKSRDSLIVQFDIEGQAPLNNVQLEVIDTTGNVIETRTVTGDVGNNIQPGKNKQIVWNMAADGFTRRNTIINARVVADLIVNSFYEKEVIETPPPAFVPEKEHWINWWFVAAGVSATAGALSYVKSNALYDDYPAISGTNDANNQHSKIKSYDLLGNIAFGMAGVFGVTGVVVQVKHNKEKKELTFRYQPVYQGSGIGLVYKF